jgi:hypothetical protein
MTGLGKYSVDFGQTLPGKVILYPADPKHKSRRPNKNRPFSGR